MEVFKIAIKLFASGRDVAPELFVPTFHRWIQNQVLENHFLIDVADYEHVIGGPGTVLICAEANIHMDQGENRLGLLYTRKTALPGSFADRLGTVMTDTLKAAAKFASEEVFGGKLSFSTDEIVIRLNDRLLAPANARTLAAVEPDIHALAKRLYGGANFTFEPKIGGQTVFEVRLKSTAGATVNTLLDRLTSGAAAVA
jgi:hypothetical protein